MRADPAVMRRVADEFREIPGLCLTVAQASRFFGLTEAVCEDVLASLTEDHVIRRSGDYYGDWRREFIGSHFVADAARRHYR